MREKAAADRAAFEQAERARSVAGEWFNYNKSLLSILSAWAASNKKEFEAASAQRQLESLKALGKTDEIEQLTKVVEEVPVVKTDMEIVTMLDLNDSKLCHFISYPIPIGLDQHNIPQWSIYGLPSLI